MLDRSRRVIAALLCVSGLVAGCDDVTSAEDPESIRDALGTFDLVEIAPASAAAVPHDVNSSGVVVGTTHPVGGPAKPFRWANGVMTDLPFTTIAAINDRGDIVGTVNGVPMVMYRDSAFTSRLFRADTNTDGFRATDINSEREITVYVPGTTASAESVLLWKSGNYQVISEPGCATLAVDINERGAVLMKRYCDPRERWEIAFSPFRAATPVINTRLQGETCPVPAANYATALNDSNEVVGTHSFDGASPTTDFWQAAGCRQMSVISPYITLRGLNNRGVLVGRHLNGPDTSGVVVVDRAWARVNDLLATPGWHVQQIEKITDAGLMIAYAYPLADPWGRWVLLVPR